MGNRIDEDQFKRTLLDSGIHKRLKASLLPLHPGDFPNNRKQYVDQLYQQVVTGEYFPSVPRGFICANKYRNVARIVPVLNYKDSCIYFFCLKQIESRIAINRTEGTFGGWQLGNPIRTKEEVETQRAEEGFELDALYGPYAPSNALDPTKWFEAWSEFQKLAYLRAVEAKNTCFVEFDISNFYDNINLDLLERKIRLSVGSELSPVVDLMFVLLRNWNRTFEGYGLKTVGVPQDEVNDCSRVLANFYLQDYDAVIASELADRQIDYLRYADDQIIMGSSLSSLREMLYRASLELHKIGLNVNSGKVREFKTPRAFFDHWGFDFFKDLRDSRDRLAVNRAFSQFVRRIPVSADDNSWRWSSVLKRLLTVGFDSAEPEDRTILVEFLLQPDVVTRLEHGSLRKVQRLLTHHETMRLASIIEEAIWSIPYNSFHLNVLRYYGKGIPADLKESIDLRLEDLRRTLV